MRYISYEYKYHQSTSSIVKQIDVWQYIQRVNSNTVHNWCNVTTIDELLSKVSVLLELICIKDGFFTSREMVLVSFLFKKLIRYFLYLYLWCLIFDCMLHFLGAKYIIIIITSRNVGKSKRDFSGEGKIT